jgi:hypothetical protein
VLDEFRYALTVYVKAMTGLLMLFDDTRDAAECHQLDESG